MRPTNLNSGPPRSHLLALFVHLGLFVAAQPSPSLFQPHFSPYSTGPSPPSALNPVAPPKTAVLPPQIVASSSCIRPLPFLRAHPPSAATRTPARERLIAKEINSKWQALAPGQQSGGFAREFHIYLQALYGCPAFL